MSLTGSALQPGGHRVSPLRSSSLTPDVSGSSMRRGLGRLGASLAEGGQQLNLQQRLMGWGLPGLSTEGHCRTGRGHPVFARSYVRKPTAAAAPEPPLDKELVNFLRNEGEKQRLERDYDEDFSPTQIRRLQMPQRVSPPAALPPPPPPPPLYLAASQQAWSLGPATQPPQAASQPTQHLAAPLYPEPYPGEQHWGHHPNQLGAEQQLRPQPGVIEEYQQHAPPVAGLTPGHNGAGGNGLPRHQPGGRQETAGWPTALESRGFHTNGRGAEAWTQGPQEPSSRSPLGPGSIPPELAGVRSQDVPLYGVSFPRSISLEAFLRPASPSGGDGGREGEQSGTGDGRGSGAVPWLLLGPRRYKPALCQRKFEWDAREVPYTGSRAAAAAGGAVNGNGAGAAVVLASPSGGPAISSMGGAGLTAEPVPQSGPGAAREGKEAAALGLRLEGDVSVAVESEGMVVVGEDVGRVPWALPLAPSAAEAAVAPVAEAEAGPLQGGAVRGATAAPADAGGKKRGRRKKLSAGESAQAAAVDAASRAAVDADGGAAAAAAAPPAAGRKRRRKVAAADGELATDVTADVAPADAGAELPNEATVQPAKAKTKRASKKAAAADATAAPAALAEGATTTSASRGGAGTRVKVVAAGEEAAAKPFLDPAARPPHNPEKLPCGLYPAVDGYAVKNPLLADVPPDVLVVDTAEVAARVVQRLKEEAQRPYPGSQARGLPRVPCRYFACDTEVAAIDVTCMTPVGHGAVLCFSIYGGDDLDFSGCAAAAAAAAAPGSAPGPAPKKDRIWVDVWNEVELDEQGQPIMEGRYVKLKQHHPILDAFRKFFEDDEIKKVWHNYGFDRHVLENMRIECRGFGGDTLHMARLADASRSGKRTYGLDNLTADPAIMRRFLSYKDAEGQRKKSGDRRRGAAGTGPVPQTSAGAAASAAYPALAPAPGSGPGTDQGSSPGAKREAELAAVVRAKISMKDRFGMYRLRNEVAGKVPELPAMEALHTLPLFRPTWIDYSALDAKATWQLREALEGLLRAELWILEPSLARQLGYPPELQAGHMHLWHFYCSYWLDFGELLTEMERRGMMVNREHLREAQLRAEADREAAVKEFLDWADSKVKGARHMNPGSGTQIRMLLFPDHPGYTTKAEAVAATRAKAAAAKATGGKGRPQLQPAAAQAAQPQDPQASRVIKVWNPDYDKELAEGKKPSRYIEVELHGIWGKGERGRLEPEILTATNAAAVSMKVLRGLAGKPGAARKELAKVLAEKAERAAVDQAAREEARAAAEAARRTEVPIVGDAIDETLEAMQGHEADGNGHEGGDGEDEEGEPEAEAEGEPDASSGGQLRGSVPSVTDPEELARLEKEAKDKGLGRLYAACGGGEEGLRACVAVEALCEVSAIDKLLSAFIIPLQGDDISTTTEITDPATGARRLVHRVHCSLNINTETGRLSARRPNLQNQPALEKDRYKVRKAFTADTSGGNTLVVADYGQLELRLLAHMTNCKSMLEAFILGGDFHSRTAYGMYDYIREDVEVKKECYLEWDGDGEPDKPLVKDKYASERRKAKVLNFSIAYGKTAHGLAVDFKTSKEEAQATVDKWYADRPEVRKWQEDTRRGAREELKVRTLLGRTRPLPNINSPDMKLCGHSSRAAINTPIQGSAADVAASAMVAITRSKELEATGFKLLMQIHDEVILEGPKENADEARRLVMSLMANPWAELSKHWNGPGDHVLMQGEDWRRNPPGGHLAGVWTEENGGGAAGAGPDGGGGQPGGHRGPKGKMPLLVELATDCNVADTWYEAK